MKLQILGGRNGRQVFVGTCDAGVGSHGMRQDVVLLYYIEGAVNERLKSGRLCLPGDRRSRWCLCDKGMGERSFVHIDGFMLQVQC